MKIDNGKLTEELMHLAPLLYKTVFQAKDCTPLPLPDHQVRALLFLKLEEHLSMTALAQRMQISKQQLTRVIDALVEKKLVERQSREENRRVVLIRLSALGIAMVKELLETKSREVSAFFSELCDEEKGTLLDAFSVLKKALIRRHNVQK